MSSAHSAPQCDTALGKLAKSYVEKLVKDHQDNACAGLKQGAIAIDQTKKLELLNFRLCEEGDQVATELAVRVRCATSDLAFVKTAVEDDITAKVSVDLKACQAMNADLTAKHFFTKVAIDIADLKRKLKEGAQAEIKPYCLK